jgi:hypothetical protein
MTDLHAPYQRRVTWLMSDIEELTQLRDYAVALRDYLSNP